MKDLNRIMVVLDEKKRTNKWLSLKQWKDPATVPKWCTYKFQSLATSANIASLLEVEPNELFNDINESILCKSFNVWCPSKCLM